MTNSQNMTPEILAARIKEMALQSITGIANRIKPASLPFVCRTLAGGEGIPVGADFETIQFKLLRFANRMPQHFYPDEFND